MDLRTVAQSGINPSTGKYLTKEERIAAFKQGMQNKGKSVNPKSFFNKNKVSDYATSEPNAIVKRDELNQKGSGALSKQEEQPEVISKLEELKRLFEQFLSIKNERVKLESKYVSAKRRAKEKEAFKKEETEMERDKTPLGKPLLKKLSNAVTSVTSGLFGVLQSILEYAVLDWISKPENKKMVESFVKGFQLLFKFFDFYIGTMVDNLLGGFGRLFGGGSILERVFGGFKLLFGIFMLRRLLNPLRIIKDIKWIFKNIGNFKKLFDALKLKDLGKVGDSLKNIFPKFAKLFKHGLKRSVNRLFLSIFGKGIGKIIKPILKSVTRVVVKPLANLVKRVPFVGPLLAIPINMFLGDPIDKAAVKAVGSALGAVAVGALGSIIPGAGTLLGAFAGGLLGDWLAGWLYDSVLAPLGKTLFGGGKKDQPQLNTGGIASGPESGYDVTLHGTEAVIPIDKLKDNVLMPHKTVASIIMGSTLVVLKSMGGVGSMIAPIALQMFNPYIRLFGLSKETFSSGLGVGGDLLIPSVSTKEPETPEDYPEKSNDKSTTTKPKAAGGGSTGGGSTGGGGDSAGIDASGIEAATGSVVDKGISIAKKFMSNLGLTKEAAAAIAGNFAHESAGFFPGIREGGPFGTNSKPWPKGTVGKGYGWAQWTNARPGDRYDKFIESYGGDYNKVPTNEDNFKFAVNEMRGPEPLSAGFKKMTEVAAATVWFRKNWERAGVHHDEPRIKYAKGILAKLSIGGKLPDSVRDKPKPGDGSRLENKIEYNPMGYAKGGKIFLHWVGSGYTFKGKGHYHSIIQGDGSVYKAHPYDQRSGVSHTWNRNSQGVGISIAALGGPPNNPWNIPIKDNQIESMSKEIANVAKMWGWSADDINEKNVYTHAEIARVDGYGPGSGDKQTKWDLLQLKKGEPDWSGGKKLRAMARGFMGGDSSIREESSDKTSSPSTGIPPSDSPSPSSDSTDPNENVEVTPTISDDDLKYLYEALTGKTPTESKSTSTVSAKPTAPPAPPKLPNPSTPMPAGVTTQSKQSMLPSISSSYTLEKKLMSHQSQPVVIVNSSTSMTSVGSTTVPLNNTTVTETNNLIKI
jgi:hypothetical protein